MILAIVLAILYNFSLIQAKINGSGDPRWIYLKNALHCVLGVWNLREYSNDEALTVPGVEKIHDKLHGLFEEYMPGEGAITDKYLENIANMPSKTKCKLNGALYIIDEWLSPAIGKEVGPLMRTIKATKESKDLKELAKLESYNARRLELMAIQKKLQDFKTGCVLALNEAFPFTDKTFETVNVC